MTPSPGIKPRPHWWDANALPLCQPCSPYVGHFLHTKHQADYHRFVLDNLQPGEAEVIVDYKMKLELGVRTREAQQDWYRKQGISLHGFRHSSN